MATDQKRSCVFCGSSPVSHEHLFPQWLKTFVVANGYTSKGENHQFGTAKRGVEKSWSGKDLLQYKVKAVCKPCNNGWMSEVEGAAMPYLKPMIIEEKNPTNPLLLDDQTQRSIATWAALRAVMFWQMRPELPRLAPNWLDTLKSRNTAPDGWSIWIAACSEKFPPFSESTEELEIGGSKYSGLLVTFAIGHLVMKIFGLRETNQPVNYTKPKSILRIWPQNTCNVNWPPEGIMDHTSLPHFFDHGGSDQRSYLWKILEDKEKQKL